MPGPWEEYQKPSIKSKKEVAIETGPWTEYQVSEEPIDIHKGLKQQAVEALPAVGSAIGGLLTKPTLVPSVVGSAIGRGAGELAKQGIEYLTEETPKEPLEAAKEIGEQTLRGASEGFGGYVMAKSVGLIGKGIGQAYKKVASAAAKVPEETLEYYAKNSKQIADLADRMAKDPEQYADIMRSGFDKKIGSFMNQQNKIIEQNLSQAPNVKTKPVIDALEKIKSKIDVDAFPEVIQQVQKEIDVLAKLGDEIPAAKMNAFKQRYQNLTDYMPTETFRSSQPQLSKAFADAAKEARKAVNSVAPNVAEANNQLARLHAVKSVLNKNLIKEGAPSGALVQAGIGRNPRAMTNLQRISDIIGEDLITPVKEYGIATQMSKAGLLGDIPTGIGLAPLLMGQAASPGIGGLLASAAASPLGQKYILPQAYKYGPGLLKAAQRGSKTLVPAASYLLENE